MSERTFRVKIRGGFRNLTAEQRAALLADAARHDMLQASFTAEGNLAYDIAARPFFTFRFLESGAGADDLAPAVERSLAAARAWLDERGYEYGELKTEAEDMAEAPLGKRGRREAAAKL